MKDDISKKYFFIDLLIRIFLRELHHHTSCRSDPMKFPHIMVLMWFILILLVDAFSKTRSWSIRSKTPFLLACSSKSNKPAFEVRFLAENSILLIKATSYPAEILFLKILTCWLSGSHFFHPMGECMSLMTNSKISPMWVKSSGSYWKLMKIQLVWPIFTSKVGLLSKCAPLTDSGT